MVEAFKNKGDPKVCDNSRGILLVPHSAKGMHSIIKDALEEDYTKNIPECQNGAIAKRGTDFSSHILRLKYYRNKEIISSYYILGFG